MQRRFRGSGRVPLIIALALSSVGLTGLRAGAGQTLSLGSSHPRVGFYQYDLATRSSLVARKSQFDVSDGLQQWERMLLAMDPDGSGPGR
jgi:hypothetical protein